MGLPTESVNQEDHFPRGSRFVTLFELKTPRPTFGMQSPYAAA